MTRSFATNVSLPNRIVAINDVIAAAIGREIVDPQAVVLPQAENDLDPPLWNAAVETEIPLTTDGRSHDGREFRDRALSVDPQPGCHGGIEEVPETANRSVMGLGVIRCLSGSRGAPETGSRSAWAGTAWSASNAAVR